METVQNSTLLIAAFGRKIAIANPGNFTINFTGGLLVGRGATWFFQGSDSFMTVQIQWALSGGITVK